MSPSVWALFAVRTINAAGSFVIPFMTLILSAKMGWSPGRAGAFITAGQLLGLAWSLLAGRIGDLKGRKPLILLSQLAAAALFAAAGIAGYGSPALPYLALAAMALVNGTWPVFNAIVADIVPEGGRKGAFALLYWGNNIGFSLGALAGGWLFRAGTPLIFLLNAAALAAVSLIMALGVKETAHLARAEAGQEAGGSAIGALLERPVVLAFSFLAALSGFVYFQHTFSLSLRMGDIFDPGDAARIYGILMSVNGVTVVLATLPLNWLLRKASPLACMVAATALYALGFGFYGIVRAPWAIMALTAVWTLGEIASASNLNAFIASHAPPAHRGRFNSLVGTIASAGMLANPLISGLIIGTVGSAALWPLVSALALLAAILFALLARWDAASRRARAAGRG